MRSLAVPGATFRAAGRSRRRTGPAVTCDSGNPAVYVTLQAVVEQAQRELERVDAEDHDEHDGPDDEAVLRGCGAAFASNPPTHGVDGATSGAACQRFAN